MQCLAIEFYVKNGNYLLLFNIFTDTIIFEFLAGMTARQDLRNPAPPLRCAAAGS